MSLWHVAWWRMTRLVLFVMDEYLGSSHQNSSISIVTILNANKTYLVCEFRLIFLVPKWLFVLVFLISPLEDALFQFLTFMHGHLGCLISEKGIYMHHSEVCVEIFHLTQYQNTIFMGII